MEKLLVTVAKKPVNTYDVDMSNSLEAKIVVLGAQGRSPSLPLYAYVRMYVLTAR